ncbi:UNVERIFIED_CONTAM: hypothetical protein Sradi_1537500 [Sesamum radiatum]|uniref:Reverse transcriptase zinc-binding domain-containing protein n=1 Tax=Sesamum radiatum TaxID=300843 RepID=A0AAW2U9V8_SESRA
MKWPHQRPHLLISRTGSWSGTYIWHQKSNFSSGSLLTLSNLRGKGIKLDEGCPLCDYEEKEIIHVLVGCPFAMLVWAVSGVEWRLVVPKTTDAEVWIRGISQQVDMGVFELIIAICWSLWYKRNKKVFEGTTMQATEVIDMARRQVWWKG